MPSSLCRDAPPGFERVGPMPGRASLMHTSSSPSLLMYHCPNPGSVAKNVLSHCSWRGRRTTPAPTSQSSQRCCEAQVLVGCVLWSQLKCRTSSSVGRWATHVAGCARRRSRDSIRRCTSAHIGARDEKTDLNDHNYQLLSPQPTQPPWPPHTRPVDQLRRWS